jgi:GAF domain-containing protein
LVSGFQRQRISDRLEELLAPPGDPGDLAAALDLLLDAAMELFEPDLCVILAINPVTRQPLPRLRYRGALLGASELAAPPGEHSLTRRVQQESALFLEQIDQETAAQSDFVRVEQLHSFAAVALNSRPRGQPLAVLYLDYRAPRAFSSQERAHILTFARAAELRLQQTWLLHRYAEVTRIGNAISQGLSTEEELFRQLHAQVGEILDVSHAMMLAVYQRERGTLDLQLVEDGVAMTRRDEPLTGFCAHALREGAPILISHLSAQQDSLPAAPELVEGTSANEESLLFVPLKFRDQAVGVLSLQNTQPHIYNREDQRVLELLGSHVALALTNIRLFTQSQQINEAGKLITGQFDGEELLEQITARIRDITRADLVLLYRYDGSVFDHPVRSGELLQPAYPQSVNTRHDHVAFLTMRQQEPVYAEDSAQLFALVAGNSAGRRGNFERREQIRSTAALPLRVGAEEMGVLFVNFRASQRFDAAQRQTIEQLASYAAVALRTSRLFTHQRERQLRELMILREVDQALARTINLTPTLQIILERTLAHIPAFKGSIFLFDPKRKLLTTSAYFCPSDPTYHQDLVVGVEPPEGLTGHAFALRQPIRVIDVRSDPDWSAVYIPVDDAVRSELDVPLIDGGQPVGVLNLESHEVAAFSQADEEFLVTLAGQAVLAIQKAQSYEREKRDTKEWAALIKISREITGQVDSTHLFNQILDAAIAITGAQAGTLMLYNAEQAAVQMAAGRGVAELYAGQGHSIDKGVVGKAVRERRLVNVPDVREPPWDVIHLPFIPDVCSELAVPLLDGERVWGVLNLESFAPGGFSERDERLLTALADQAVIVLQNAERFQEAQEQRGRAEREATRVALLYHAGRQLATVTDESQAYAVVGQIMRDHFQARVVIRRFEAGERRLVPRFSSAESADYAPRTLALGEGLSGRAALLRQTLVVSDVLLPPPEIGTLRLSDPRDRSVLGAPITIDGQPIYGTIGMTHRTANYFAGTDITLVDGIAQLLALTLQRLALAQAEAENAAVASIGHLAFGVAHKLGNYVGLMMPPINRIRGELQRIDAMNSTFVQALDEILNIRTLAKELTAGLKQLSGAADSGAGASVFSLNGLLEEVIRSLQYAPDRFELAAEIAAEELSVLGSRDQIGDILVNLFVNAVQVMPHGGQIAFRCYLRDSFAAIDVSDTGPGIAAHQLAKIFELSFSTKEDGLGFGLWSARRYALANKGDLTVQSRLGEGTTFTLLLPRVSPNADTTQGAEQ